MASHSGTSGIVFQFRNVFSGDFYIAGFGQNTTGDYSFVETLPATLYIPGDGVESKWFLLTMTYNGSVFKIYKDNTEVYSANSTFETPTENHFELGSSGIYTFSNYIGKMDDLLIYDRALTPQELTQLFQQTASKY
jgi:Concanavalin A-like lectin/glucanases superfamily